MIAVDTSVLSLAFRRARRATNREDPVVGRLREAIRTGVPVFLPGICLQEVLSGVRTREEFDRLTQLLSPFPVLLAARAHHVAAARIANTCRTAGVTATAVDALIAAITMEHRARLLTTDRDFAHIARICGLKLEPHAP